MNVAAELSPLPKSTLLFMFYATRTKTFHYTNVISGAGTLANSAMINTSA